MKAQNWMLPIFSWVIMGLGILVAMVVFTGISYNGVRQHVIEPGYLGAVPLPLLAFFLAARSDRGDAFTRCYFLVTFPIKLLALLIVGAALAYCTGVLK